MASPQIGDHPKLVVTDFQGEAFDLSQKHSHWVIVHFFASWCPGCKTELPELVKLYQKYRVNGLEVIALSPEPARKKKDAVNFMKTYPLRAGLIADANTNDFGSAVALPTTYLLNPSGEVQLVLAPNEKDPSQTADLQKIEALLKKVNQ